MKPINDTTANAESQHNVKILLNENIPIEELLGSVTTYNNVDGSETKSQQLRTSARVFKKMKLDSANNAAPTVTSAPEKKEPPLVKEEPKPPETKKPFRPLWSPEDKNLFFEGLNEYGKDFESIQSYISNKLKKKGLPESVIKTKDQVRHLYYRTWHKISKHLKFSTDIKKIVQELYGLINYGEMRRKIGSVSEKTCLKLNELMYTGMVTVRRKGKTVRIKTPMCRALRKLNSLDENHEDLKLPSRVCVEVRPKDMNCWMTIQSLAQNPRIKTLVPLQKRLSSIITCIKERWKSQDLFFYEKTLKSVNNVTMDCLPDPKVSDECRSKLELPLRLAPPADAKVEVPTFNVCEYLTCNSISLNEYEERVGVRITGEQLWPSLFLNMSKDKKGNSKKSHSKRQKQDIASDKNSAQKPPENTDKQTNPGSVSSAENYVTDSDKQPSNVVSDAVNTILTHSESTKGDEKTNDIKIEVKEEQASIDKREQDINRIRRGWTLEDCGTLCIGEIYLMIGHEGKVILEYSWDGADEPQPCIVKQEVDAEKPIVDNTEKNKSLNPLNASLDRLLSVAKLHYRKNIIKCPCGHVCGGPTKPTSSGPTKPSCGKTKNTPSKNSKANSEATASTSKEPVSSAPIVQLQQPAITTFVPVHPSTHLRPITPTPMQKPSSSTLFLKAQLESLQRLRPRFCSRRGRRPRGKQVVVERKLPVIANKGDIGHQIVQMNIISQDKLETTITPEAQLMDMSLTQPENNPRIITPDLGQGETFITEHVAVLGGVPNNIDITDNAVMPASRVGSPTSISNLLDMALGSQTDNGLNKDMDMQSFAGLLSDGISSSTPPVSPSRLLKENENQWLNSEVADFSLSSFLGHLESPMKSTSNEEVSQEVDAQLQSLLMETSIDYTAKFADLAAHVTSDNKKL